MEFVTFRPNYGIALKGNCSGGLRFHLLKIQSFFWNPMHSHEAIASWKKMWLCGVPRITHTQNVVPHSWKMPDELVVSPSDVYDGYACDKGSNTNDANLCVNCDL